MTKSRIQKLRIRFALFINREEDINRSKLLADLDDYRKEELKRGFTDPSVQSELIHTKLMNELESMINSLKPSEETEGQKKRLP